MYKKGIWILAALLLGYHTDAAAKAGGLLAAETVINSEEASDMPAVMGEEPEILYNVSFPAETRGYLDPGNLSNEGQIFSSQYAVENYGNTDVVIKIKNIDMRYASSEDVYELSEEEIVDKHSKVKKLNIDMVWGNRAERSEKTLHISEGTCDEEVLTLAASEYDENGEFAGLSEGSSGFFYFTGTLNSNPDIVWEDGEITVRFDYEITGLEKKEENEEESSELPEEILKASEESADDQADDETDDEIDDETKPADLETSGEEQAEAPDTAGVLEDVDQESEQMEEKNDEGMTVYETDDETADRTGDDSVREGS